MMTRFSERSFGFTVGTACAVLSLAFAWRGRDTAAVWAASVSVALVGLAMVRPALLRWPARAWSVLAYGLGWLNGRILLSLLFFAVFTPLGLLARLMGKDLLRSRPAHAGWSPYPERLRDPKHYERMF